MMSVSFPVQAQADIKILRSETNIMKDQVTKEISTLKQMISALQDKYLLRSYNISFAILFRNRLHV